MNGYVLGRKNSEVYLFFTEEYYYFLLNKISKIFMNDEYISDILSIKNFQSFLMGPQLSSLILALSYEKNKLLKNKLSEQISYFQNEHSESISDNIGNKILGTNILFSNVDINPFIEFNSHPEHTNGLIGSFGKLSKSEWLDIIFISLDMIKKIDRDIFDELDQHVHKIIPHGTSDSVHNSGSFSGCLGQIYIGYTLNSSQPEINILEAIIHESSHNKLNLIMHFDKVIECSGEEKFYSAIRPDLRPIRGVFLGYHAFVPTMYVVMKAFLSGQINDRNEWINNITLYYIKTKFLQKVIKKHAVLTKIGKEIDIELDYTIGLCDLLFKEINPSKDCILHAKKEQLLHFNNVNKSYSNMVY